MIRGRTKRDVRRRGTVKEIRDARAEERRYTMKKCREKERKNKLSGIWKLTRRRAEDERSK